MNRSVLNVTREDLQEIQSGTLSPFLRFFIKIFAWAAERIFASQTLKLLLHEDEETKAIYKIYRMSAKIKLAQGPQQRQVLPKNQEGKIDFLAARALIKQLRQESELLIFPGIGPLILGEDEIKLSKPLAHCLNTAAKMCGTTAKARGTPLYFRQLLREFKSLKNLNGNSIENQIKQLLREKADLYQQLSMCYHAQTLTEGTSSLSKENQEKIEPLLKRYNRQIRMWENAQIHQEITTAIAIIEEKIAKIDAIFRASVETLEDHLAIFDVSTDHLVEEMTPKILDKPVNVTMIGVEYNGLIKEGGLAEALEGLAVGMKHQHTDNHVRLIFPNFNTIPSKVKDILSASIPKTFLDSNGEPFKVFTTTIDGVECHFIEDPLFDLKKENPSIYGPSDIGMKKRFAKFSQLAADLLPHLGPTDVIHLHDWHVSGVALKYKKDHLKAWEEGKTPPIVFTFHNNSRAAQGRFAGCPYNYEPIAQGLVEAGIASENINAFVETLRIADCVTTVSPTFAIESQSVDTGEGVSFATREAASQGKLFGVINGSNPTRWNPVTDPQLSSWKDPVTQQPVDLTFGPDSPDLLEKKQLNKDQLAKWVQAHFPDTKFDPSRPLITFIGRFDSYQKGLDKLDEAISTALDQNGQLVIMGSLEDPKATKILNFLQKKYQDKNVLFIRDYKDPNGRFHYQQGDEKRAGIGSVVRAATDILFVPSTFEPCGLVQFEGWLFGSLAVGSRVGGLADTIIPPEKDEKRYNGFLFDRNVSTGKRSLEMAMKNAIKAMRDLKPNNRRLLISQVMKDAKQCSWSDAPSGPSPVARYRFVYENAMRVAQRRTLLKKKEEKTINLWSQLRRIGSQSPHSRTNILEEKYFRLLRRRLPKIDKLEKAYYAMRSDLRMQAPDPYAMGVNFREYQRYGAHMSKEGTHFEVPAPGAKNVQLKLVDTNEFFPMKKGEDGSWSCDLCSIHIGTKYQYIIDGRVKIDPYGRGTMPAGKIGDPPVSVVQSAAPRVWSDSQWILERTRQAGKPGPMSIFEVYPTAWRKKDGRYLNYRELAPFLARHCQMTGHTHVEIMGLLDHPSESSWGYQVSSFFAPNNRMGSPEDLQYLIEYLHKENIGVIMDFIPCHFSIDDYALNTFDGTDQFQPSPCALLFSLRHWFFHWGTKFFDYSKKQVRDFLVSSATYWIETMHIDALRIDAVHPILLSENSEYARLFLKQLNSVVHKNFPGVLTIAEDYSGSQQTTQPFFRGGYGFDMKWNIGWMKNTLDFFSHLPSERKNYYQRIVKAVESDTGHKMVMAISHDEVKKEHRPLVKMTPGLSPSLEIQNLKVFLSFMYTTPGKKLLFMGSDTASQEPWESFIGKELGIDETSPKEIRDVLGNMMHHLNALNYSPSFFNRDTNGLDVEWIEKNDPNGQILSFRRSSPDQKASFACIHNFTDTPAKHTVPISAKLRSTKKQFAYVVFHSDNVAFGGNTKDVRPVKMVVGSDGTPVAYEVVVPPLSSVVVKESFKSSKNPLKGGD